MISTSTQMPGMAWRTGTGSTIGEFTARLTELFFQSSSEEVLVEQLGISTESILQDIKKRTGLSWEHIAQMCGVSRQTIHSWLQTGRQNYRSEQRLYQIQSVINEMTFASSFAMRTFLLYSQTDVHGELVTPYELLKKARYDDCMLAYFAVTERDSPTSFAISEYELEDRIVALQEKVHKDLPGTRKAHTVKRG